MKALLVASAVLLAAMSVEAKPHLETVFDITMPAYKQTAPAGMHTMKPGSDMLYVALQKGMVTAANLTSKSIVWTANVTSNGPKTGPLLTAGVALNQDGSKFFAYDGASFTCFDAKSGMVKWSKQIGSFVNTESKANITTDGAGSVALVSGFSIMVFDEATGHEKSMTFVQSRPLIDGMNVYYYNGTGIAKAGLFSGDMLWFAPGMYSRLFYAFPEYLLATNTSFSSESVSTTLFAFKGTDGTRVLKLEAMGGIDEDNVTPTLDGDMLTVVAGLEDQRKMTIDLKNGYIVKQVPYAGGVGSFKIDATDMGFEIKMTQQLQLEAGSGESFTVVQKNVPSNQDFNLQYYGSGVVQIGNLQGYTLWEISSAKVGTLISRNEMTPHWEPAGGSNPLGFDGAFIQLSGQHIIGVKFVK